MAMSMKLVEIEECLEAGKIKLDTGCMYVVLKGEV